MTEHAPQGPQEEGSIYAFIDLLRTQAAEEVEVEETSLWVFLSISGRKFVVPMSAAREIHRVGEIVPVPDAPASTCGVVQLRGRVIAVIDPAVLLGLGATSIEPASRILVAESRSRLVGMLVDGVDRVVELADGQFRPRDEGYLPGQAETIQRVVDLDGQNLGVLELDRLLRSIGSEGSSER